MKKSVIFEKERDTKNTVVFTEKPAPGTPSVIGTLYLQKWFVGDQTKLTVTLEFGESQQQPTQT